ncbi:MAG TPA: hypothetical protein VGD67_02550 [Pseudonocardiaceae bacterium]
MNASPRPAGEPARYPTAREVVSAAMTTEGTDRGPDRFLYRCQDLDGAEHILFLVPLGQRIAMVFPEGATAVLDQQAVLDLGRELDDAFMADAPGGLTKLGEATGQLATSLMLHDPDAETAGFHDLTEPGSASVDARAHATQAALRLSSVNARATLTVDLAAVRALKDMFTDAEHMMLGNVPPDRWNGDTDGTKRGR